MTITVNLNFTEAIELKSADRQACLADIKSLGVDTVRCEFPWQLVAKSWTWADALMADVGNAGLHVLGLVAHPPLGFSRTPPPPSTFGQIMHNLTARYPQITAWEIWNEPNLDMFFLKGNPKTWTPYLLAGSRAVKDVNANTTVVFGGLAAAASHSGWTIIPKFPFITPYTNTDPADFLKGAYAAGAKGFFDVLAYHPYCVDAGFRHLPWDQNNLYVQKLYQLAQVMATNGDSKPIRATEYGFSTKNFNSADQGTYLAAETAFLKQVSIVDEVFVYCYRDNNGEQYGLRAADNTIKPAYTWFAHR